MIGCTYSVWWPSLSFHLRSGTVNLRFLAEWFNRFAKPARTPLISTQAIEKIGGPGRTRTCNQTVMSE